ncbi:hypothetical protein PSI15_00475 [Xenorhabdus sp. PR6a]|uniref:hypothetical protein n=1 Tax=Xenorhabdus sp. PR6a TaxID=3025877 RepID=UPI00235936DC|nr:hypothetical protein [Xenorhabdus sp. PR6a]MDC9580068.1 hypothetical protein [Xenorhabdus sp. PR6a]
MEEGGKAFNTQVQRLPFNYQFLRMLMNERFFLYLDILGFTELVRQGSEKIDDLYEVIASLNVHNHDIFKVIVFSDTIVVYNVDGGDTPEDARYLIMFMCEFVRDLMYRLMKREVYFRAIITYGDFTHYEINGTPCFYGNALIDAYHSEKELKAIGLFIDKKISHHCEIFKYREFNENYDFVYVTQCLDDIEMYGSCGFPIPSELIESTNLKWFILPEIEHVNNMYIGSKNDNYTGSVRKKYATSWDMYCKHYPHLTTQLLLSGNDVTSIAPDVEWKEVFDIYPEDYSYAIETKIAY